MPGPNTFTSVDQSGHDPSDPSPRLVCSFKGDNAYPTGGYTGFSAYIAGQVSRGTHVTSVVGFGDGGGAAYALEYDAAADALKVRLGTTLVEVSNGTDLSAVTFKATVFSK